MKKLFFVIPLIVVFAFFGCTKDSNPTGGGGGGPAAPTNVTITATTDGLAVVIGWTAVAGVDSYEVETPDHSNPGFIIPTGTTQYTDNSPNSMGTYRVRAYDDNTAGSWSSTVTTLPSTETGIQIGEWTHSSTEACYYWDASGAGHLMSSQAASGFDPSLVDIYLYDNNTSNDFYFVGSHRAPCNGNKTTYVASDVNGTYTSYAPPAGLIPAAWYEIIELNTTNFFWVELENGHYVRILVTSMGIGSNNKDITFNWWYQPVQGFRYVD